MARSDERSTRLMQIPGLGTTTATALLAAIGNGHDFKNGRQLAAWPGLTPGQYSSGGKIKLGRITKASDRYLRTLLILGAQCWLPGGEDGPPQPLGHRTAGAYRLRQDTGGHCSQERAPGVGDAGKRQ